MGHIIADRVADTSTTTGASDFTVSGTAPTGFRTLDAVLTAADTFYYCIEHQVGDEWEIGLGTYAGSDVFERTTVLSSSNANSAVTFSAGTKNVLLTHPAARMVDGITMGPTGIWTIDVSGANDLDTDLSNFEVESSGDTQTNVASTTYSDTMGGGTMHCKFARGSKASPSPVLAGDFVGGYGSRAWHSGGAWQVSSPASMHWIASEDQTATDYGMYLRFLTTPKGSTTRQERVIIADTGTLWAHDEATYDPKVETQTKPFPDATVLGSRAAAASSAGSTLAAVHYAGSGTAIPGFRGGAARGTPASPTAVQANDFLAFLGGHGYAATGWVLGAKGLLTLKAAENWTDSAQGTYATIETTPIGSTTRVERLRVTDDGALQVAGVPIYSNIPQNSQSTAYTTVLADAQKHLLHPTADNNTRTFTIDSNANVPYPVGTAITFVNQINTLTIAITSDTLVMAGTGSTGSRTLAANGIATALKINSTAWMISGTGLS